MGEISNAEALTSFLEASLQQIASSIIPLISVIHREPNRFPEMDALSDAFLSNHVANRASRQQGRALLNSSRRIFGPSIPSSTVEAPNHLAPVFGSVTHALGVARLDATELFLFQHLRGLTASAIRLGIVGPLEAQTSQRRLAPRAREVLAACETLTEDDIAQTAPLLEIWQGGHDRLYSRLFQS